MTNLINPAHVAISGQIIASILVFFIFIESIFLIVVAGENNFQRLSDAFFSVGVGIALAYSAVLSLIVMQDCHYLENCIPDSSLLMSISSGFIMVGAITHLEDQLRSKLGYIWFPFSIAFVGSVWFIYALTL